MTINKLSKVGSLLLLVAAVVALGFMISLYPPAKEVAADITNQDYCGIGGAGYMSSYCTGLGFDMSGDCGGISGGSCCDGGVW